MPTDTRQCLACGTVEETKRSLDYSLAHAGCGGQLVKKREYDRHKSMEKVYTDSENCPTCGGDGKVYEERSIIECPDCGGHGDMKAYDDPKLGQMV